MERLYGEYEYTYVDTDRKKGMEWVQKYLRMKHVIVFKMSHDVLQVRFPSLSVERRWMDANDFYPHSSTSTTTPN